MSATSVRLWLVRETPAARLYTTAPQDSGRAGKQVWVPRSIVEHTSKDGDCHTVKLPDWFVQRENL